MATREVQFGTLPAGNAPVEFGNPAAADGTVRSAPGDAAPPHGEDTTTETENDSVIESED
jgi:hypothetical protein